MVRISLAVALCLLSPCRHDAFAVPKLLKPIHPSLSTKFDFPPSVLFMASEDGKENTDDKEYTSEASIEEAIEETASAFSPQPPQDDPELMEAKARAQAQLKEMAEQTPARKMTPEEETDIVAAALGGGVIGVVIGELAAIQFPDVDMTLGPVVAPILGALLLSGAGYAGGSLDSSVGVVIRSALGRTTRAVGTIILNGVKGVIQGVVASAQDAVEKTKDDIKAIPGKFGDSATRTYEETAAKVKAAPGMVSEAAQKRASEIGEEIKATPQRVADSTKRAVESTVDNTKQAIEDAVDDAIDAVEDAVDEVISLPTKAVESVENSVNSVLGKPLNPAPPKMPPPMNSIPLTPLKPKAPAPPASEPESFIPKIETLKIEVPKIEMPKIALPKFEMPKPAAPAKDRAAEKREEQEKLRQAEEQLQKSRVAAEARKAAAKKKKEAAEAKAEKESENNISQEVASLARRLSDEKTMAELEIKRKQDEVKKNRAQTAEKSLDSAAPRATVSLGSWFNFGSDYSTETTQSSSAKVSSAPRGVPTLSKWRQNKDGSITGRISGSRSFDDGDAVTTSSVPKGATNGMVVQTQSGSK
jgi:regulator of protease activity HflC (stomatin/prohibitin superfamily)